jgi:hypothetical protein
MFVDTDLLCMGAEFSHSAAVIAQRGADRFAATQPTAGIFGDFSAAHDFHRALCRAHASHTTTMQGHRAEFDSLGEKATSAAAVFVQQDATSGAALDSAGRHFN